MTVATVVAVVLISVGAVFLTVSAVGLVRFPDFYTRAHVVAKSETVGIMLVIGGLVVHHGFQPGWRRLLLVVGFAMIANPTSVHAIGRAAQRVGLRPWRTGERRSGRGSNPYAQPTRGDER